jgi:tetratricopeptide (TPR) repeat protein
MGQMSTVAPHFKSTVYAYPMTVSKPKNGAGSCPAPIMQQPSVDTFNLQTQARSIARPTYPPDSPVSIRQNPAASTYYTLGERAYQSSHFDQAIDAFSSAIALNPTDYMAYNKRGVAEASLKDYPRAFADYTQAIALQPAYYNAYINRGNLWVYLRELAQKKGVQSIAYQSTRNALADFTQAIRLNPFLGVAYENRSELYSSLNMHQLAAQDKGVAIRLQRMKQPRPLGLHFCPPRIALVLGNDDYIGTENDLSGGPVKDATMMAQKLRAKGFQVITGFNLDGPQTKLKVAEFINKLHDNPNAVSLTYYSGHGGSINGNNYLIPTDYSGSPKPGFTKDAVSVDYLLNQLKAANTYFNIIFLDACRTPIPDGEAAFKSGKAVTKQWETEPSGPPNAWIDFASRQNEPALQVDQGLYTKYLLQNLDIPNLSLKDVSMLTSYELESDPNAVQQNQHASTQTDLSKTEAFAEAFCFNDPCALSPKPAPQVSDSWLQALGKFPWTTALN